MRLHRPLLALFRGLRLLRCWPRYVMWWSCSCSFAAGCRHIAPPALLPAPLAFLGRELLPYGIYFRLAARTGLVEGKKV